MLASTIQYTLEETRLLSSITTHHTQMAQWLKIASLFYNHLPSDIKYHLHGDARYLTSPKRTYFPENHACVQYVQAGSSENE